MYGSDWGQRKLRTDWIAFGILFIVISSVLCIIAGVSVLIYFPLLFLSVLIAYVVSNALLRWFERMLASLDGRFSGTRKRRKNGVYRHW
jgi:hypothetical protein